MAQINRVLFLGSKGIGLSVLKLLNEARPNLVVGVVTLDDRSDSRTAYHELQKYCSDQGMAISIASGRKQAEEIIASLTPDICFVAGWYWLFSDKILRLPSAGFVGLHHALLPRYRGGAPVVWALMHGEREVGSSIFQFSNGMDDGPIWGQAKVSVGDNESVGEVLPRLEAAVLSELGRILPGMLDGFRTPVEQDHSQATYCSQRCPEDGLINWSSPAREVHNFIRAQSPPYPGAFSFLNGRKAVILRAHCFDGVFDGPAAQVVRIEGAHVVVACGGRGAVVLEQIEHDGRIMAAGELIRSIKFKFSSMPGIIKGP